jgi:hypothetical protein
MTEPKTGGYTWNRRLNAAQRSVGLMRQALAQVTEAIGGRNSVALHYLTVALLHLGEVQDVLQELKEIGE